MNLNIQKILAKFWVRIILTFVFLIISGAIFFGITILNVPKLLSVAIFFALFAVFQILMESSRLGSSWRLIGLNFDKIAIKQALYSATIAILLTAFMAIVSLPFGAKLSFDGAAIDFNQFTISVLISLILAAYEEFFFRGSLFQAFFERFGNARAIVFGAIIFSFAHIFNDHIAILPLINIAIAGALLSYLWIKTRSLIPCVSFHFFWNFCTGSIIGAPVSGNETLSATVFKLNLESSLTWITGGYFGLEGGIIATITLIGAIALIKFLPIPVSIDFKKQWDERHSSENALISK